MKTKIPNSKDFYSGVLFIFLGLTAVLWSVVSYPIGTGVHMGPGIFPIIVGSFLTLFGFIVAARALMSSGERIKLSSPRPLILVLLAVLIFALTVEPLGLVLATLALVFLGAAGGWEFHIREVSVLFLILAATVVGLFVYGLEVPFKLWPW